MYTFETRVHKMLFIKQKGYIT